MDSVSLFNILTKERFYPNIIIKLNQLDIVKKDLIEHLKPFYLCENTSALIFILIFLKKSLFSLSFSFYIFVCLFPFLFYLTKWILLLNIKKYFCKTNNFLYFSLY